MIERAISIGEGKARAQGKYEKLAVDIGAVDSLADALRLQPAATERWWSPHLWLNNYRNKEKWMASIAVTIDVDYNDKTSAPPPEMPARLAEAARTGALPGSLFHLTPHGCRIIFVFDGLCKNRDLVVGAYRGAGVLVQRAIAELDMFSYAVDWPLLGDLARFFFTPNSIAKGVARTAELIEMRSAPYTPEDLAGHEQEAPPERPVPETRAATPAARMSNVVADAIESYNRDRGRGWPKSRGTCPACGHKECFGTLPKDPMRWACFSTNHDAGCGIPNTDGKCFHGDALDIDAFLAGVKPVEYLRREGYLRPRIIVAPAPVERAESHDPVEVDATETRRPWRQNSYLTTLQIIGDNARNVLDGRQLEYNEMIGAVTLGRRRVEDVDATGIRALIEARFAGGVDKDGQERGMKQALSDVLGAMEEVGKRNRYHPVREYLQLLKWDGVDRLKDAAAVILGAPGALPSTLLYRWFLSAAARPLMPGCKVDTVLILVGAQGAKKSSFFRVLAGEFFVDTAIDISKNDAYGPLHAAWILEWAELESLRRARDAEAVKAFITSAKDLVRKSYGRFHEDRARSGVIVGSTNNEEFLADDTGNRRFHPIRVGPEIDLVVLDKWRDQLWAEAVAKVTRGERWWLEESDPESVLLHGAHEVHTFADAWEEPIGEYLARSTKGRFRINEIMCDALGMKLDRCDRSAQMRVARVLKILGWKRRKLADGNYWSKER